VSVCHSLVATCATFAFLAIFAPEIVRLKLTVHHTEVFLSQSKVYKLLIDFQSVFAQWSASTRLASYFLSDAQVL
jgi:hypothetical protein